MGGIIYPLPFMPSHLARRQLYCYEVQEFLKLKLMLKAFVRNPFQTKYINVFAISSVLPKKMQLTCTARESPLTHVTLCCW
jgi:hypothetical protein